MSEDFDSVNYRQQLDIQFLFQKQVDRCLASVDTEFYPNYVMALARMLPSESYHSLMAQSDMFTELKNVFVYKHNGSSNVGYESNPMVWNKDHSEMGLSSEKGFEVDRLENGDIDWSDPNIYSPTLRESEEVDYDRLFFLVLTAAENNGITWKSEKGVTNLLKTTIRELQTSDKAPRTPKPRRR